MRRSISSRAERAKASTTFLPLKRRVAGMKRSATPAKA